MKKLIIIILILMLTSIISFAELSDETQELVEDLRFKHYGVHYGITGSVLCVDEDSFIVGNHKVTELIDIKIKGTQFKGWEIWINDKCYYVLLVEKEE